MVAPWPKVGTFISGYKFPLISLAPHVEWEVRIRCCIMKIMKCNHEIPIIYLIAEEESQTEAQRFRIFQKSTGVPTMNNVTSVCASLHIFPSLSSLNFQVGTSVIDLSNYHVLTHGLRHLKICTLVLATGQWGKKNEVNMEKEEIILIPLSCPQNLAKYLSHGKCSTDFLTELTLA